MTDSTMSNAKKSMQDAESAFYQMIEEFNRQEHAIECKRFAEKTIREAIQSFEQETGLKVDGIDYSRSMKFADPRLPSHVFVTIRAMLP